MSNLILKRGALACLLVLILTVAGKSHFVVENQGVKAVSGASNQHFFPETPAIPTDSLAAEYKKYEKNLTSLTDYLARKDLVIDDLLQDSRFEIYERIDAKFTGSAEKKSLGIAEYKKILGFNEKANRISGFINTHSEQLKKAEETYDISRYVISAILGVESDFGVNSGSYNPFNTYVSMYAVGYRAEFARAQLEELLIFARERDIDLFELKSSYAGAMSFAQFIPYSLNKWFIGNDLYDMDNNILSVANYLAYFKERTGSIEKAVYRYNPSSLYTETVLELAREAENNFSAAP